MRGAIGRRGHPERPAEGRRERPDAPQADEEADVRHGAVGVAQQRGGALHPPGEEVLVRRLPERPPELAAEMGGREVRRLRERRDVERLAIAGVGEVLCAQEVPHRVHDAHRL